MSGNTIGKLFTVTTSGESHGAALLGIVDGVGRAVEGAAPAVGAEVVDADVDRSVQGERQVGGHRARDTCFIDQNRDRVGGRQRNRPVGIDCRNVYTDGRNIRWQRAGTGPGGRRRDRWSARESRQEAMNSFHLRTM